MSGRKLRKRATADRYSITTKSVDRWVADPKLPVVICTAHSDYTWEEIFERLGNTDHLFILKKPFERIELLQMAHTLAERRRTRPN